jgi:hypothetical protein
LWDLLKTCFGAVYLRQQRIEFFGDDFLFSSEGNEGKCFMRYPKYFKCLPFTFFRNAFFIEKSNKKIRGNIFIGVPTTAWFVVASIPKISFTNSCTYTIAMATNPWENI